MPGGGLFVAEDDSDDELLREEFSQQEIGPLGDPQAPPPLSEGPEALGDDVHVDMGDTRSDDDVPLYPLIPIDTDNEKMAAEGGGAPAAVAGGQIRPVSIQLALSLPFQYEMIQNCLSTDDPLMIMGKGLGMSAILSNLLHILGTPTKVGSQLKRSLVIVLNASDNDTQQIAEGLQELSWLDELEEGVGGQDEEDSSVYSRQFTQVTSESLSVERDGSCTCPVGVLSVTSRILIVDLLSGILHPNKVTGMVVLNVETLKDFSNESFILEIYRSQNRWGFIKGFSESPESFVMEFSPLLRRMRDLRFQKVLLWPRFRVEISSCLNNPTTSSNVFEVKVSLTNSMSQIQFGLMECLKKCLAELNRKNPQLALEWWDIDNVLNVNLLRSIDSVMLPNWHRISYDSKQLVKDIRFLKHLLKQIVSADAVDFYEEIQLSLEANKPSISRKYSESPWLLAEESQLVISHARKRIFYKDEYQLEEQPKWDQLLHIIDDIAHEKLGKQITGPTLIACSSTETVRQLTRVLSFAHKKDGFRKLMLKKLQYYKDMRQEKSRTVNEVRKAESEVNKQELSVSSAFSKEEVTSKRRRTRGASFVAAVERLRNAGAGEDIEGAIDSYDLGKELELTEQGAEEDEFDELIPYSPESFVVKPENDLESDQLLPYEEVFQDAQKSGLTSELWEERKSCFSYIPRGDQIIVEKFSNLNDELSLQEQMPSYIIIFEPDLSFIRRVELYRASCSDNPCKVYFMYYGESVEEQNHLTAIKREKDAFSKLIRENANIAHHYETMEDISHFKNLAERKIKLSKINRGNARNAGGQRGFQNYTQDVVVVDTREFNASLPGLLFRYGVRVVPCMLSVGDYIITPEICLERKSISDLIGSLQNNRLVSQCKKMQAFYKYPTLLIEFDGSQSFSLEPFGEGRSYRNQNASTTHPISSKLSQEEIQSKLAKVVMKFPRLRIIWSSSPLQSVNIILELKLGREQPNPTTAIEYGTNLRKNAKKDKVTLQTAEEVYFTELLKVPGVSNIDYFNLKKKVKTFARLKKLSMKELTDITGDQLLAEKVLNFVQQVISNAQQSEQESADDNVQSDDDILNL
ncbi:ssDNA endodeoxyribonuclease RAD1 KNAG_0A02380 [Huiozyma naganishii CBS 8797]|uniref:ERCC4 domain-containing protein n=1 Tax=Huiozyma naganishii (strain ATCC MYA-139 / BCRC 22969 / CBS 8797 / KCTC 17520 / NBRC 10181 / NCYC 3082 / Yp74L-3) TaxID=1071383 RepID=J7RT87_HUIN7|nr:hypothetical protein KNAG_0A02380 [Kazachstania naganishii CBS 8797]CCK67927.1 hypothetical protein KNAG_0A02380 [Kazachstania naganishii CBS 8797]